MIKGAKPIEELLKAPEEYQDAIEDWFDYEEFETNLNNDIRARFDYPSLWAAIDKLTEFTEKRVRAEVKARRCGYTFEDMFALHEHYKAQGKRRDT